MLKGSNKVEITMFMVFTSLMKGISSTWPQMFKKRITLFVESALSWEKRNSW